MLAMFNGQPIFGPRGPAGPDGNPIGTIISYMGVSAPTDYLICDGSVYNISDYSKLAEFFKTQFGSENYFGGDGTTTFAVPDMRNLFLRGYHGAATEQLSGEIGKKQEATGHIDFAFDADRNIYVSTPKLHGQAATNVDSVPTTRRDGFSVFAPKGSYDVTDESRATYTSRPVNMAVLYCIKATVAETYEDIYSTEETRIGTWIDGKPLYRTVYSALVGAELPVSETFFIVGMRGLCYDSYGAICETPWHYADDNYLYIWVTPGRINFEFLGDHFKNAPIIIILEYTKTTD